MLVAGSPLRSRPLSQCHRAGRGTSRASLPLQRFLTLKAASHTDGLASARDTNGECQAETGQLPSGRAQESRGMSLPDSTVAALAQEGYC